MVFELTDHMDKAAPLFDGWEETLITSCLQKVMGRLFVTDRRAPRSACACVGDFAFYAGEPDAELFQSSAADAKIFVPQNEIWAALIERCVPNAKKMTRYAFRKDTKFDEQRLRAFTRQLPDGYELRKIDHVWYDKCLRNPQTADFVSNFKDRQTFLAYGLGVVVVKDGEVVSGASSYTRYLEGIEIEVDTVPSERRKHLATAACAALILNCLKEGLYPSWDAANLHSAHLAQMLGYEFSHTYPAYEIS